MELDTLSVIAMDHWAVLLPLVIVVILWMLGQDWHEDAGAYRAALDELDADSKLS